MRSPTDVQTCYSHLDCISPLTVRLPSASSRSQHKLTTTLRQNPSCTTMQAVGIPLASSKMSVKHKYLAAHCLRTSWFAWQQWSDHWGDLQAGNNPNAKPETCKLRPDAGFQTSSGKQQKSIQADSSPDAEPGSCEDKADKSIAKEAAASKLAAASGRQPMGKPSDSSLAVAKMPPVDGTSKPSNGADKASDNADKLSAEKASDNAATQGKSSGDAGDKTSEQSGARRKVRLPDAPLFVAGSPAGADRTVQWVQRYKLEHPECSDAEALTGQLLSVPSVPL